MLLFYTLSNVFGMVYVNLSNLNNYRENPLLNKFATYSSLAWTLVLSPVFFLISMLVVLRTPSSLSSLPCIDDSLSCQGKPFTWNSCFVYNVVAWNGGYLYGLCMTYFKLLGLKDFNLVPSKMKRWPLVNWVVFLIGKAIALCLLGYLIYCYIQAGVQYIYLAVFLLIICGVLVPALILRKTYWLHVHHYNVGMFFLVLVCYQDYFLAIFSGIANGYWIEGVTVYAYDPVFKRRESEDQSLKQSVINSSL